MPTHDARELLWQIKLENPMEFSLQDRWDLGEELLFLAKAGFTSTSVRPDGSILVYCTDAGAEALDEV